MTDRDLPASEMIGYRRELRQYLVGLALALLLSLAAFGIVWAGILPPAARLPVLAGLAVVQIVAHFRYFLHIDLRKSHRDDLHLILFTALIAGLMVGGTIWILFVQHARM